MAGEFRWLQVSAIVLVLLVSSIASIRWLAVGLHDENDVSIPSNTLKESAKYTKGRPASKDKPLSLALNKRQRKLLRQTDSLYYVLERSAARTITICQTVFNESRWNCSSLNHLPELSPELTSGTREQAYVYALASARLAIDTGRACAAGVISGCPCQGKRRARSSSIPGGFGSEGCAISYKPGLRIAQRFINAGLNNPLDLSSLIHSVNPVNHGRLFCLYSRGRTKDGMKGNDQALWTRQHNSKFGMQAVARAMEKKCKCHGMSASCEIKTCWRQVNEPALLTELKEKYNSALTLQQKTVDDNGGGLDKRDIDDGNIEGLIFNKISSDYCNPDPFAGSYGTQHRVCGNSDMNNCDWMCCGRGYTENIVTKVERCRCEHIWCCYVQCDNCTVSTVTYHCK